MPLVGACLYSQASHQPLHMLQIHQQLSSCAIAGVAVATTIAATATTGLMRLSLRTCFTRQSPVGFFQKFLGPFFAVSHHPFYKF